MSLRVDSGFDRVTRKSYGFRTQKAYETALYHNLGTLRESGRLASCNPSKNDQSGSLPDFLWLGRTAKRWPANEIRLFRRGFLQLLGQDSNLRQGG